MAKLIKRSRASLMKEAKKGQRRGKYRGNPPKRALYPKMRIVAEFYDKYTDSTFDLWFTTRVIDKDGEEYANFKLVCRQKRPKANYWFGYNMDQEYIASQGGDHYSLKEHYTEMYYDLERFLLNNYSNKGNE